MARVSYIVSDIRMSLQYFALFETCRNMKSTDSGGRISSR